MKPTLTVIETPVDANRCNKPYRDLVLAAFDEGETESERENRRERRDHLEAVQLAARQRL